MAVGHLVAATIFVTGCTVTTSIINGTTISEEKVNCSTSSGILMLVSTAVFVGFFAISWGPIAWIYAAEIFPLNVRARAMSLTTGSNWFMGTIMSYILELIKPLGIHGVFYLFSALSLLAVGFVYLFCPETRGVLLEDIEDQFDNFQLKNRGLVKLFRRSCKRKRKQTMQVNIVEMQS
jgi:SP family sugar:H+ symporter-like MFS transporter